MSLLVPPGGSRESTLGRTQQSLGSVNASPNRTSLGASNSVPLLNKTRKKPVGGVLRVCDRGSLEDWGFFDKPAEETETKVKPNASPMPGATAPGGGEAGGVLDVLGLDRTPKKPPTFAERREIELKSKLGKVQVRRGNDQKQIRERVESEKILREKRYHRLLDNVSSKDNLAFSVAQDIRELNAHEEQRRRQLYKSWDEQVFQPLQSQMSGHLNPPNRRMQQRLNPLCRSVDFNLPKPPFKLQMPDNPLRQPVMEGAREAQFQRVATDVLSASRSAPNLHLSKVVVPRPDLDAATAFSAGLAVLESAGGERGLAAWRCKPMLEPSIWSQQALQGTLYGHFAQECEGPGAAHPDLRCGSGVFVPDERDGVESAGKRKHARTGYNDIGILHGERAYRGETSDYRSVIGASSGAPGQDHYAFETGGPITDQEFPPGKRVYPHMH